jgi:hypothetical protein
MAQSCLVAKSDYSCINHDLVARSLRLSPNSRIFQRVQCNNSEVKMINSQKFRRILLTALILTSITIGAEAKVAVMISDAPAAREAIIAPANYSECYTVPAGISNGIWLNAHTVCNYNGAPGNEVWIGGYWGCTRYSSVGVCMHWNWYQSHWMRDGYVEYGVHYHHHHDYRWHDHHDHYDHHDHHHDHHDHGHHHH